MNLILCLSRISLERGYQKNVFKSRGLGKKYKERWPYKGVVYRRGASDLL